jgi:hypothetical protein
MARYNPLRSLTNIAAGCTDIQSLAAVVQELVNIIDKAGIPIETRDDDEAATVDDDGNYQFPTSNPARAKIRFELNSGFTAGVAEAFVVDAGASALNPNEPILVTDAFGLYTAAVGGEQGYADVMPDASGGFRNEITTLHGVGAAAGTDNYTVKLVDGTDTADFLDAKLEGVVAFPTYDSMVDVEVQWEVVPDGAGAGKDSLRAFVADGITVTAADEKVKVSATDTTAGYLFNKLVQGTTVAFHPALHMGVNFDIQNNGGNETLRAYVLRSDSLGQVRVSSTDDLDYLEDQFTSVTDGTYNPAIHVPVFVDKDGGSLLQIYIDGKVKVNSGDEMAYLADQFLDWESGTTYDSDLHELVVFNTATAGGFGSTDELRGFVERGTIAVKLTADLGFRDGDELGAIPADTEDAEWVILEGTAGASPTFVSQDPPVYVTLYNSSRTAVNASGAAPIYLPAFKWADGYLAGNLELYGLSGMVEANDQSIGHDEDAAPEWQDDGDC